jgi:hypothetical protein
LRRDPAWVRRVDVFSFSTRNLEGRNEMKRLVVAIGVVFLLTSVAGAASLKTYQVTGPVLEVGDDYVVVQKGNDKWQLGRDKDTKLTGDLKVGSKVTIQYIMRAAEIEVKEAPKKEAPKKEAPAKK